MFRVMNFLAVDDTDTIDFDLAAIKYEAPYSRFHWFKAFHQRMHTVVLDLR
jgi:hypothetical protein